MIPRYSLPEMLKIWSDENKFQAMLNVEIYTAEAMAKIGQIPKSAAENIKKAKVNIKRIAELERSVKHETIAFLTAVGETVGKDARYMHLGLTSSDALDTALAVQMRDALKLLIKETKKLADTAKKLALKYKMTPIMGRSHGVHAEPMTFGLKVLSWYSEMQRSIERLEFALENVSFGKISGAVGTMAHLDIRVETYVCKKLGLKCEPVSTQIIPRDRHSIYFSVLAHAGTMLERISTEIRHLQRTEVLEVEEPFSYGQKGSSAMPHKRNPIMSENICGLSRLLRGWALTAMENISLWHERDMSHSSTERIMFPDASLALFYMVKRMQTLLSGLTVYPENMLANINKTKDIIFSGKLLLSLVDKGLSREAAYALVQKAMFKVRDEKMSLTRACAETEISKYLTDAEIKKDCDLQSQFKNINNIFRRTFSK